MSVPIVVRGGILATNGTQLPLDAFSRVRTSLPVPHFLNLNVRAGSGYLMDGSVTAGGSLTLNNATANSPQPTVTLVASGASATTRRQSYQHVNYTPGVSRFYLFTAVLNGGANNTASAGSARLGAFNDYYGLFWQYDKATNEVYVGIRNIIPGSPNTVQDTVVARSSFNTSTLTNITGLEPTSPVTVDFTYMQVFYIDQEWLGAGTVRFGVFVENTLVIAHVFTNVNSLLTPYTATPNYPLRFEVLTPIGEAGSMQLIECCSFCYNDNSTGEHDFEPPRGILLSYIMSTPIALTNGGPGTFGTETPLLAIRATNGPLHITNGTTSFISIRNISVDVLTGSDVTRVRVYRLFSHFAAGTSGTPRTLYGAVTGTFNNTHTSALNFGGTGYPLSLVEVAVSPTVSSAGGIEIASFVATSNNAGASFPAGSVPLGLSLDNTRDVILVTGSSYTNTSSVIVSIDWGQPA